MSGGVLLRRWRRTAIAADAALNLTFDALGEGARLVGLCASPSAWRFVLVGRRGGALDISGGPHGPVGLADLFDLRAFVPGAKAGFELRWRATPEGGVAAWITTDPAVRAQAFGAAALDEVKVTEVIESRRLLFGEGRAAAADAKGWSWLREARIGQMAVPVAEPDQRVEIVGQELVAQDPRFGNAHVVDEVLTGIGSVGR